MYENQGTHLKITVFVLSKVEQISATISVQDVRTSMLTRRLLLEGPWDPHTMHIGGPFDTIKGPSYISVCIMCTSLFSSSM